MPAAREVVPRCIPNVRIPWPWPARIPPLRSTGARPLVYLAFRRAGPRYASRRTRRNGVLVVDDPEDGRPPVRPLGQRCAQIERVARPRLTRQGRLPRIDDMFPRAGKSCILSMVLVGATLAGPALCAVGLTTHACDAAFVPAHGSHHSNDGEQGCRHEESCPGDPCNLIALRSEPRLDLANLASTSATPPLLHEFASLAGVLPCLSLSAIRPVAPGRPLAPLPPSDVPLLI